MTYTDAQGREQLARGLRDLCDEAIVLAATNGRLWRPAFGKIYSVATGLKPANYKIGRVEFSARRLQPFARSHSFDCVLYEYWYAARSTDVFRAQGIPCVLDMHDILWKAYERQLCNTRYVPSWWKRWALRQYRNREEQAWSKFDGLIALNREEFTYLERMALPNARLFYAPMGVDLCSWPFRWQPATPPRLAYYGGLGTTHNQKAALRCFREIMPVIWERFPAAELWLVGSDPPASIRALARDPRVRVTGYLDNVQHTLATMTAILCPWSGTYGFRSRLVEVMALGVPVVATSEAVYGMDLEAGKGILLGKDVSGMVPDVLRLLVDADWAVEQSRMARQQVAAQFGFDSTYGRLACELRDWLQSRGTANS